MPFSLFYNPKKPDFPEIPRKRHEKPRRFSIGVLEKRKEALYLVKK
tara:strand:+ start:68 stop:205 length:138 start_codon:yes stop_codon:yes gene_type:complete